VRLANRRRSLLAETAAGFATAKLFVGRGAGRHHRPQQGDDWRRRPGTRANALAIVADATTLCHRGRDQQAVAKFGKLDVRVRQCRIAAATPLGSATLETFEKVISTNITAVFFTVQAACRIS